MGGALKLSPHNPLYLFHLLHQIYLCMQSPCGIGYKNVIFLCLCRLNCIVYYCRWVCTTLMFYNWASTPLSPYLKLFNCSSPECISCCKQYLFPFFYISACKFFNCGCFSYNSFTKKYIS